MTYTDPRGATYHDVFIEYAPDFKGGWAIVYDSESRVSLSYILETCSDINPDILAYSYIHPYVVSHFIQQSPELFL